MNKNQPWYIEQRSEALALVYLTRRTDLLVTKQQQADSGVDYIVEILKEERQTRRIFGLQVKAQISSISEENLNSETILTLTNEHWIEQLPFPICFFLFTLENDRGFYKWLTEPNITVDKKPKLRLNTTGKLAKLDTEALESIISQTNQWYDALLATLAV